MPTSTRGQLVLSLLATGVVLSAGCANRETGGPPRAKVGVDVGLRRGGAWTTFNVRPSRVVGSTTSLEFRKGQVVGFIDGAPVKLEAKADELTGMVGGRVALDVASEQGKVEISGVWNDNRVHFEITPEALRGAITGNFDPFGKRIALEPRGGSPVDVRPIHCQYVLDRVESDGARAGVTLCDGMMPLDTRLEFPDTVDSWLGRGETVVVLLALLSSSPI
jgi:hypothetical protein